MTRTAIFAAIAAGMMIGLANAEDGLQPATALRVTPSPAIAASGAWKLETDHKLDGALQEAKSQLLSLEVANGQLVGRHKVGRGDGRENSAVLTGQIIPGSPAVVTMRQDDAPGHTTTYVGQVVAADRIVGTYVDNRGASGDWLLTLVAERSIEPAAAHVPDDLLFASVLGVYGRAIRGDRHPFINLRPPHRNLWTDEIKEFIEGTLSYGEVDYIGTAKLIIPEPGIYTVDLPGAGVEFRLNGQRVDHGDVELQKGVYDVEIYTNHWGQPYLTYAQAAVFKKGTEVQIPFVNTAKDIEAFRSQKIAGRAVVEVCEYAPKRIEQ